MSWAGGNWPSRFLPYSLCVARTLTFPQPSLGTGFGARNTEKEAIIASLGGWVGRQVCRY